MPARAISARDAASRLLRRATARRLPVDHAPRSPPSSPSAPLRKDLDARDLLMLGVGGVIGGGVFVLTGAAAHDHAGPAVLISYLVASATSAVTGLCYTEFACEAPVAGSSYVYVSMCFGEFAGYLCGCNLGLELTISAAAVARGWTSYVATLFRAPPDALRVRVGGPSNLGGDASGGDASGGDASGGVALDLPAAFVVAFITCVLVCGMKDSARFNTAVTAVSLAVIAFVLVAGGAKVDADNWRPFAPNGVDGILAGASVVFFSFVGFDTVATCAEECADPGRDLPVGILGSLGVCAALYAAMCLVVTGEFIFIFAWAIRMTWFFSTGMTPSRDIDVEAPFAVAFKARGMGWAESVISLGALAAITTALLSSLMGQPRVYMVMARDGLLPKWFAAVHPKFGTPANASAFTGITTGLLALVVDIETLAELVSIGTLAVFGSVCASLLVWRHSPAPGEEEEEDEGVDGGGVSARSAATWRAGALVASCVAFGASHRAWSLGNGNADLYLFCAIAAGVCAVCVTCSFNLLERRNEPTKGFKTPFVPYVPAIGVAACTQLVFSLGPPAWVRFGAYTVLCAGFYAARGLVGDRLGWWDDSGDGFELAIGGVGGIDGGNEGTEMTTQTRGTASAAASAAGAARDEEEGEGERAGLLVAGAATSDRRG